jgi:hypothetical protein
VERDIKDPTQYCLVPADECIGDVMGRCIVFMTLIDLITLFGYEYKIRLICISYLSMFSLPSLPIALLFNDMI